jgi:hypothetical protein
MRKFQNNEIVIFNEKLSKSYQTHYKITPNVSECVIVRHNYNSEYVVKFEGREISVPSSALSKPEVKTSKESFQEQIVKAKEKIAATQAFIAETESKIAFLAETGSDTFIENEFKAYHTLSIIEQSGMSKIEKAKAIAALISGK